MIGFIASGSTLKLDTGMAAIGTVVPGLAIVAVLAASYFLPTIVAVKRHKPNMDAIFALNLLLGWTLLGWVGALVWSLTAEANPRPLPQR